MPINCIDDKVVRVDAEAKARGEAMYVSDYSFPDMLYARMIRSDIPRGTIDSISVPQLPDGYYFISAKDIPEGGKNELWMIAKDWRCFADGDVRYVGETIGLLVGPDRNMLDYLAGRVKISYTEQEPAVTIDDALSLKGGPIAGEDNVLCSLFCEKGEKMQSIMDRADSVFTETIETGFQEHVHLDTNGAIITEEDGKYLTQQVGVAVPHGGIHLEVGCGQASDHHVGDEDGEQGCRQRERVTLLQKTGHDTVVDVAQ